MGETDELVLTVLKLGRAYGHGATLAKLTT